MDIYHFLNLFFYFEILVLLVVFFFILFKRITFFFSSKREAYKRKQLSDVISACFLKKSKCELIEKVHTKKLLLEVLETFNHRFSGQEWDILKNALSKKFLLPKARLWTKKISWNKRNFAARVFALSPLKEDERYMLEMINDTSFLVASIASSAAIKLASFQGVKKTLVKMMRSQGYSHYFYADLLSQGSSDVFSMIFEICRKKNHLHLACLEVLAMETTQIPLNFLAKDLHSKNIELKKAALRVAIRNPQQEWLDSMCLDLFHEDEMIRKLAASGLANYQETKSYKALKKGLEDESVNVRLACAISLKNLNQLMLITDTQLRKYVQEFE